MELQDVSKQLPEAVKRQYPLEIYDRGKLVAVAYPPEYIEEKKKRALANIERISQEVGKRTRNMTREQIKALLEIDDDEYDALGLGHERPC